MASVRSPGRDKTDIPGTVAALAVLALSVATTPASDGAARRQPAEPSASDSATSEPRTAKKGVLGRVDLALQRHPSTAFPIGVVKKFSDDRAGRLAALIAYYGFFSMFPALLALVTVLGFVLEGNDRLRNDIADSALAQFPIIGESIAESVRNPLGGNTFALVAGLAGAVWAGLGMMQATQDAMNQIWDVARRDYPNFFVKRVRSAMMLLLITVLLVTSTALAQLATLIVTGALAPALLFALTLGWNVLIFMVAYRVLTVARLTWRQVLPGACVASVAYTVLQLLGGLYVSRTLDGASKTYGTFAVVIGLLSWIFLIAQVTMVGAEINVVAARKLWPRSLFKEPATTSDRVSGR